MKFLKSVKSIVITVLMMTVALVVSDALAVSSSNSKKVRDYYLNPSKGKVLQRSDISLAIRQHYRGVRPRISKRRSSNRLNCYDVKFIYKNELKRVSFNCTSTKIAMSSKY